MMHGCTVICQQIFSADIVMLRMLSVNGAYIIGCPIWGGSMRDASVKLPVPVWELVAFALLSYSAHKEKADPFWEDLARQILRQCTESERK